MTTIPAEFLPRQTALSEHSTHGSKGEFEAYGIQSLFAEEEEDNSAETCQPIEDVAVASRLYKLSKPPDVGTLFAHCVWSGSKMMSEYVVSEAEKLVHGKRTIEFGAGTALPSLVALAEGSNFSCITDYPDEEVLQSICETVGYNWETVGCPYDRVVVVGHDWGTNVENLMHEAKRKLAVQNDGSPFYFDVAFLSECLWMHSTHEALAKSLNSTLHPRKGVAIVTYAHHIPGVEDKDDAFFDLCLDRYGLESKRLCTKSMAYMWDNEKTIDVHLVRMNRV